jgi:hypothetical protein
MVDVSRSFLLVVDQPPATGHVEEGLSPPSVAGGDASILTMWLRSRGLSRTSLLHFLPSTASPRGRSHHMRPRPATHVCQQAFSAALKGPAKSYLGQNNARVARGTLQIAYLCVIGISSSSG